MHIVVHARDLPGVTEKRAAMLAAHRAYLDTATNTPAIRVSGPLIENGAMCGSLFIYEAPDLATVRAFVARDPMVLAEVYNSLDICEFDWRRGTPS